jgi:hypothetical protein
MPERVEGSQLARGIGPLLAAVFALALAFPHGASAQGAAEITAASCNGAGMEGCIAACRTALEGYNELFRVRPVPDLALIRERSLIAQQCEALVSDASGEVDDDLQSTVGTLLASFPADRDTASGCAYAITAAEFGAMQTGSDEFNEIFTMVGCGAYAELAEAELVNAQACAEEQAAFEAVIDSTDLEALRAFDASVRCRDYKMQTYLRIAALEEGVDGSADTVPNVDETTVADVPITEDPLTVPDETSVTEAAIVPDYSYRFSMLPPDRDPAPPALSFIE